MNFEYMGRSKALKFKNWKINITDSSVCASWKPIDVLDNTSKYSYMFSLLCLCSAKNMFLLSILSNIINDSVSR